jgi:hypothetical protein
MMIWAQYRSRKATVAIYSKLTVKDDKGIADIRVRNANQRHVVIGQVRLPFGGFMRLLRLKNAISVKEKKLNDVSQGALRSPRDLPAILIEDDVLDVSIDIDAMMVNFFQYEETLQNKFIFGLFAWLLPIEACATNGQVFQRRAHREIRYYVWKKYKDDPRTYGGTKT